MGGRPYFLSPMRDGKLLMERARPPDGLHHSDGSCRSRPGSKPYLGQEETPVCAVINRRPPALF